MTWADLDIPEQLRAIGRGDVGAVHVGSAAASDSDEGTQAGLDELANRYRAIYDDAAAISHDVAAAEARVAQKKAVRETRARLNKQVAVERASSDPSKRTAADGRAPASRHVAAGRVRLARLV
ncbi:MAG: hypothetical protein WKF76_05820 [Nocardioidaceae bacterium]